MVKKLVILTVFTLIGTGVYILTHSILNLPVQRLEIKRHIMSGFKDQLPKQWGLAVTGVKTRLATNKKVIALTFDACGGARGSCYDEKLINFLKKQKIKATLFINSRWIDKNHVAFLRLASDPLFEIENHGSNHLPCSVNGKPAYGIKGTKNAKEVIDEIDLNGKKIEELTGKKPRFYRSGTAHYDEIAVKIAEQLGYQVVNFNVNGDLGATASAAFIYQKLFSAQPGSIIILHMNQPRGETAEGLIKAIPILRKKWFSFVKLKEYNLE